MSLLELLLIRGEDFDIMACTGPNADPVLAEKLYLKNEERIKRKLQDEALSNVIKQSTLIDNLADKTATDVNEYQHQNDQFKANIMQHIEASMQSVLEQSQK